MKISNTKPLAAPHLTARFCAVFTLLLSSFYQQPCSAGLLAGDVTSLGQSPFLSFLAIGDWGDLGNKEMVAQVGKAMDRVAGSEDSKFVISVGDNFYSQGVTSTSDPLWQSVWIDLLTPGKIADLNWYTVLGNHDWYGDPQAQIDYSEVHPRWNMPKYFWDSTETVGDSTVAFIFIDTNLLNYGYEGTGDPNYPGNQLQPNFIKYGWVADSSTDTVEMQLNWIEAKLQEHQDKDYIIVIGHHDVVLCDNGAVGMVSLSALLEKYTANAYLFGHRHSLGMVGQGPTLYLQTGAGGQQAPPCPTPGFSKGMLFGFAHVKIEPAQITFQLIQSDGEVIYTNTSAPRAAASAAAGKRGSAGTSKAPSPKLDPPALTDSPCDEAPEAAGPDETALSELLERVVGCVNCTGDQSENSSFPALDRDSRNHIPDNGTNSSSIGASNHSHHNKTGNSSSPCSRPSRPPRGSQGRAASSHSPPHRSRASQGPRDHQENASQHAGPGPPAEPAADVQQPSLSERLQSCTDVPPGPVFSCEQQRAMQKCGEDFMVKYNYCAKTCQRAPCAACDDIEPPGSISCEMQKSYGKCLSPWMIDGGFCKATCGNPC